tara:strand:- start:87 stop:1076 length:990 start_codon:yes stop_codon:yes gene_type:complete
MQIGDKNLNKFSRPFLVAEAGSSHGGDQKIAIDMVHAAIKCGADAVTFQEIYEEALYTKLNELPVSPQPRIGWDCLKECRGIAKENNLCFSVCVTDLESLDKALSLSIDFIKIVSYDVTFVPFLKKCGSSGLPIFMSTGASTFDEIEIAIKALNIKDNLVLYHTDCGYPTKPSEINLLRMLKLKEKFNSVVGYCDHTDITQSCILAAAMGAKVIEKHLILDKKSKFNDYEVALEPDELQNLFKQIKMTSTILGSGKDEIVTGDKYRRENLRRSIALNCDLEKGSIIKEEHLTMLRPSTGLPWEDRNLIIGKKIKFFLKKRQILRQDHFQ